MLRRVRGRTERTTIGDPEKILDVASTQGGATNVGLAGTKRLMDDVVIESHDGLGTTVKLRRWLS